MNFVEKKEYIYYLNKPKNKNIKIASFDLDHTIISTKSGNVFPKNKDDWKMYNDNVIPVLTSLHKNNYEIIIFTNQAGFKKKESKKVDFLYKINKIKKLIKIPFSIFISIDYGYYRKPCTGCFQIYKDSLNNDQKINLKKSFYCGDAAGRPKDWMGLKMKKDFSSSDLFFAKNINVNFHLPEEIFGDLKDYELKLPERKFLDCKQEKIILPVSKKLLNIIILVGKQASGKSFLAEEIQDLCKNLYFIILSKDELKTKIKKNIKMP